METARKAASTHLATAGQARESASRPARARGFNEPSELLGIVMDHPHIRRPWTPYASAALARTTSRTSTSHNPRSTVGTITEVYDYLRLLYARVGTPRCPDHGIPLEAQTVSQMVD